FISRNGAYLFRSSNANVYLTIYGIGTPVGSAPPPGDGLWHHYCAAKNGTTAAKIYVDGVDVSTSPNPSFVCPNGSGTVLIGASHNGGVGMEPFPGWIDEPMVFNTYLPAARIPEVSKGRAASRPRPGSRSSPRAGTCPPTRSASSTTR